MRKWQGLAAGGLLLGSSVVFGASRVQAACIDPLTSTVDTLADCLFVDKGGADLHLAFAVDMDGTGTPPADQKKIECVDGASCDADGAVNGSCVFRVGACVNLAGGPAGTAASADITGPSAKDAANAVKKTSAVYNRRELVNALEALLPTGSESCTSPNLKVKVDLKRKTGKCASPVAQSCNSDQECDDYCIPTLSKDKAKVGVTVLDGAGKPYDKNLMKLTCLPAAATAPGAQAFQVADAGDLIGGPLAVGRIGDYTIRNGNVRAVIRNVGREHSYALLNGGQVVDADVVRDNPSEDRDSWQGIQPMINISSTQATDTVTVENNGADGKAAIIRSSGRDDLLDVIQPDWLIFSAVPTLSIPQSAVDVNLPVQVTTDYILSPFSNAIQIATKVENLGASKLDIYMGDFVNPSGQLEPFGPGQGFGESQIRDGAKSGGGQTLDFLAWQGRENADGLTYGLVFPKTLGWNTYSTSAFAQTGVYAWLNFQDLYGALSATPATKPKGSFSIPAGGENTLRRWFVIGKTVADVTEARTDLFLQNKAALQGTVTVNGTPIKGAHVALVNDKGNVGPSGCPEGENCVNVFSATLTDEAGFYRFMVPEGDYRLAVRATGTPYEGGLSVPAETPVTLKKKKTLVQDIDLPGTATVTVNVVDQDGSPVAAKVSVVGVPASVDPLATEMVSILPMYGRYFGYPYEDKGDVFGLATAQFADASGTTGAFELEPGSSYHVVVSHGGEFDVYDEVIDPAAGGNVVVNATVNRVVDTTGFVSMDNHVHMLNSPDSAVSNEKRIVTMLAEGVDYFSSTDHEFVQSLSDELAIMGVGTKIASAPGEELTTSQYGHYNIWPMTVDAAQIDGGAFDYGRAGEPNGLGYPSDNSYDVMPRDMFAAFDPATQVIQINHFNSGSDGLFRAYGIDTTAVPPTSSNKVYRCVGGTYAGNPCQVQICLGGDDDGASCTTNADCPGGGTCSSAEPLGRTCVGGTCTLAAPLTQYVRLDPAEVNMFDNGFTALEVWIEAGRSQTATLRSQNLSDWFNMLNNGIFKAGVSDSDTHSSVSVQAGGPRTYVASSTDDPASVSPTALAQNTNGMRAIGSNGLFMRVTLQNGVGGTASHILGSSRTVELSGGGADKVKVHVEAPTWAQYDTIDVYMNSNPSCKSEWTFFGVINPSACDVTPTITLQKTLGQFTVSLQPGVSGAGQRQVTDVEIPVTITDDTWVVVVARGTDGVSKPLFPMNPQDLRTTGNDTLAALTDGGTPPPWNLGEEGSLALTYSNPLFFDDGDGKWADTTTILPGL